MAGGRYKEQVSREKIKDKLRKHNGNVTLAASELELSRTTLRDWITDDAVLSSYLAALRDVYKIFPAPSQTKEKPVPFDLAKPDSDLKLKVKEKFTLVVSCVQNNTPLFKPFIQNLFHLSENLNAQFIAIPIRYKNVTAYVNGQDFEVEWPKELKPYYLNDEFHVNDNLVILGNLKVQATATSPLSGLDTLTKTKSAIVGHPQIQMRMVPTPIDEYPRKLLTTGSCSKKNYSESKAGYKASQYHTFGAVIIEVEGDTFWTRIIEAEEDGSFYDLDTYYQNGSHTSGHRVAGLFAGDIHNDFLDPNVVKATWTNPDSIVNVCKPEHQFLQDILDFYSANHHHKNNIFTKFAKYKSGMGNVQKELDRLVDTFNTLWDNSETYYHVIASNHQDALTRWLMEADPKLDSENALIYHRLMVYMLENTEMTENGSLIPNPLDYYLKDRIKNSEKTFFHSRNEKVNLYGIDHSQHGDRGPNGSRGTLSAFSKSGYPVNIGHGHSPGKEKEAFQAGTSSRLRLEYNVGYSSWFHTHILTYKNGKRTTLDIIKDKWRLKR